MGMWVTNFCSCCSLKHGCRNIAIYLVILTSFQLFYAFCGKELLLLTSEQQIYHHPNDGQVMNWYVIFIWGAILLTSLMLFLSTFKEDVLLVLPFVIVLGVKLFTFFVLIMAGVMYLLYIGIIESTLLVLLGNIFLFSVDLYIFLVTYSYFEMLREYC